MINDLYGDLILESTDIAELIYTDRYTEPVLAKQSTAIEKFNEYDKEIDSTYQDIALFNPPVFDSIKAYDKSKQSAWNMPDKYKQLDVESWLMHRAPSGTEDRVRYELYRFKERDLIDVLRFLVYLVDMMRENKIVWGVGRGSSIASYCLYLIGIHKVDSIRYCLDFDEFLKP